MSDSPRTDDHILANVAAINHAIVCHDFARQLERELNEAKLNTEAIVVDFRSIKEERDQLRAELEKAGESLHYSNGVADLAMKHRNAAEQELEKWHEMAKELATLCLKHENIDSNITRGLARFTELEKSI